MRIVVEATSGPGQGQRFLVNKNQVLTIGRTEWSDIAVPNDPQISSKHFVIENTGDAVRLSDLNSTNGTMLNGQFVKQAALKSGDRIVAGTTEFRVQFDAQFDSDRVTQTAPNAPPVSTPVSPATPVSPIAPESPSGPGTPVASPVAPPTPVAETRGQPTPPASPAGFQSPIVMGYDTPAFASGQAAASPGLPVARATPVGEPPRAEPDAAPPTAGAPVIDVHSPIVPLPASPVFGAAAAGGHPAGGVVPDSRRAAVTLDGSSRMFQVEARGNYVRLEGFPPADPQAARPSQTVHALSALGRLLLVTHHAKAGLPVPDALPGEPLFHWLPTISSRAFGPLLIDAASDDPALALVDAMWATDSLLCVFCRDLEAARSQLLQLVRYNPLGFVTSQSVFGYYWPTGLTQIVMGCQPKVIEALFGNSIVGWLSENPAQPEAWQLYGRPGIEHSLAELGFQEIALERPPA